ncbi:hypothetical protein C0J52_08897 [Blattella germanica]|nr:hypothetical protein C0J52_08897 [Blattella germanica]
MSSSGVKFSGEKWNVRTLYSIRWPGEGSQESGKFTLFFGGATKPEFGTGFLVRRNILSAIRDIKFVSDKISYIILKGNRHDFIIVNVYGPTEASDDTIKDEFYEELESVFDRLSRYLMKIFLGDFNAKVGRENIFRPTIGKFSLHEDSNGNGVRLVTFATSKNLIVKSTTFQHKDIHKYTWTSPDGETRNQILDCNSDHHLVRVKIRERLALTRGTDTKDDSDKFELKNLRNDEVRLEYQIKITSRFETLECSEENVATEEETKYTIKLSASESVGHLKKRQSRKWFDDECIDMVHKRKLAKMNWMHEPNEQNSKQIYAKSILNRWGNYFNQLLNVHGEEEIEKNNLQTAEVLVEEPSAIEVEMAIEKFKMYKASGEKIHRGISLLSTSYKILTNILVSRLTPNRSTIYQIFSLRQILEKKWDYNDTVRQLYVDFKKAYDSIKRGMLYSILMNFGIAKKLVRLIGMCLNGTKSSVRVGKQVSDIFEIHNGLKQGDALSPLLSNLDKEGVELNSIHKLLLYADDIVLLGDSEEILKDNMHILRSNTRKLGLEVNVNKTKYKVTHRNASYNENGQLMTNEGNFEEVAEFKYLGALITNRNEIQKEIKHRLNSGNACYYALQRLLSSQLLSKNIKLKIYKTVILPVILYGLFENKVLRKIFIIRKIVSRRLRWAGHVARMRDERGVRRILEGKPEGKRPVGRRRMKWEININHDLREVDYTDRDVWRAYVRTAMNLRVR